MQKNSFLRCGLLASLCLGLLGATVADDFAVNTVAASWQKLAFSGGQTSEAAGKFWFHSRDINARSGFDNFAVAGYVCKTHKVDTLATWTIEMDYGLTLPSMSGSNLAGVGGFLQFGDPAAGITSAAELLNGYSLLVARTSAGYQLIISRWLNGDIVGEDVFNGMPQSGKLLIAFSPANDRLRILVNGTVRAQYSGFVANNPYGRFAHFGFGGYSGEYSSFFTHANKSWIDNFRASGAGIVAGQ